MPRVNLNKATIITEVPRDIYTPTWIGNWAIHGAKPPRWSNKVAKERVKFHMQFEAPGDSEPYILLGRRVCNAFKLPADAEWFEWYSVASHRHTMIPVPARGRHEDFIALLDDFVSGRLPRVDYVAKDEKA